MQLRFKQLEVGMTFVYVGHWIHLKGVHMTIEKKMLGIQMVEVRFATGDRMMCDENFINKNFLRIEYAPKPVKKHIPIDVSFLMDMALERHDYEWCKQLKELEGM